MLQAPNFARKDKKLQQLLFFNIQQQYIIYIDVVVPIYIKVLVYTYWTQLILYKRGNFGELATKSHFL